MITDLSNTWPYINDRRKEIVRQKFTLTPEQYCELKVVHENLGEFEINLYLWWSNFAQQIGFKWWTMEATDMPLVFTAEVA